MKPGAGGLCFFVMCVMFCAAGHTALAQSENTGVYTLGEVVVSARQEGVAAKVQTQRVVTAREIKQRGVRTLAGALALVPGVVLMTGGGGIAGVYIRGFRPRDVVLLLNGTPFKCTYDGQFDPSSIPVENIAKIEVINGGASVLYGPGGVGGVINIITKTGKPGVHGAVQGEGGRGGEYLASASLSGAAGKVNMFVSADRFGRDGFPMSGGYVPNKFQPYQGKGLRDNSALFRSDAFANVGWSPSDRTTLGLTYSYISDHHGIPPFDGNPDSPFADAEKYERVDNYENNVVQFAMSHNFSGPLSFKGWGYYSRLHILDNFYDNSNYDTQDRKGSSSTDSTTSIAGANVQVRGDFGHCGIATVAFMCEDDVWNANGFRVVNEGAKKKPAPARQPFNGDDSFQIYSGLFQYAISPIRHLGLVAGLGLHRQVREKSSYGDYSYVLGAYYDLLKGTRLKLDASRKVRFPTLRDLYNITGVGGPQGNPDLVPEWSLNYEAGIEQVLPADTLLSITGFIIDAHNFIQGVHTARGQIAENHARYLFRGFEISVENSYIQNLLLRASYSFMKSENDDPGIHTDKLQYRPEDKVALDANYLLGWGTSINVSLLYVANQYDVSNDGSQAMGMPSYTVVNIKVDKRLMHNSLDVYAGVNNLFDENYEDNFGFPMAGEMVYGGCRYRF